MQNSMYIALFDNDNNYANDDVTLTIELADNTGTDTDNISGHALVDEYLDFRYISDRQLQYEKVQWYLDNNYKPMFINRTILYFYKQREGIVFVSEVFNNFTFDYIESHYKFENTLDIQDYKRNRTLLKNAKPAGILIKNAHTPAEENMVARLWKKKYDW